MNLATLRIYLVSRPHIDLDTLNAFIADKGIAQDTWCVTRDSDADDTESKNVRVSSAKHGTNEFSDGEVVCEAAARGCYDSYGRGRNTDEHIRHLVEIGHGSCLEHANYTFIVTGVSRSLTHELVRHRVGMAYSQRSQRYVDESQSCVVPPPPLLDIISGGNETDPDVNKLCSIWENEVKQAHAACNKAYTSLIPVLEQLATKNAKLNSITERRKWAREQARSILPNMVETQITVTANLRSLRHLIYLRASEGADTEIRRFAVEMYKIMAKEAPCVFFDMKLRTLPDGSDVVDVQHTKV